MLVRLIYILALVSVFSIPGLAEGSSSKSRPNVIMVITDDQGYGDLSLHGNPIVKTPNLDSLGRESTRFTNYHVAPTCSPTRAGLLTGRWNNRTGVWHTIMGRSMLRENEKTIADLLKANGYQTAMFGKWHLGDNYPYRPEDRGFEHVYYHGGGGLGQTPDHWDNAYFDDVFIRNGVKEPASGFVTDILFDEAISYIDKVKNAEEPFFAYISTNAPHSPMHAPEEYAQMYADKGLKTSVQYFYSMITNIDDNVAKLRRYLTEQQLDQNTIFIFTTDNGTAAGDKVFNAGMRGKKSSEYDGGHRVPFFLHWPSGGLAREKEVSTLTSFVDIVPTLLDLTSSTDSLGVKFDGMSLKPLLTSGLTNNQWPSRVMFTDSQRILHPEKWRKSAVMTDKWRLINGQELYDMDTDPGQSKDVASNYPKVVNLLRNEYERWWSDISRNFGEPTAIHLGSNKAPVVSLTSHDWLGDNEKVPWQQRQIRQALREKDGVHKGYWYVDVRTAGIYKFRLSRWPLEANRAITAPLKKGGLVPGQLPFRATKGVSFDAVKAEIEVGDMSDSKAVTKNDVFVEFSLRVPAGKTRLKAQFIDAAGKELGAYYLRVEKMTQ